MVDAIVSFAVQRLGVFLIQEAVFLHGVEDEAESLKTQLRWMRAFLKDAEQKQEADERIRVWVSDIQDIAYDTQDVIETFNFKVKGRGKLIFFVQNCFGLCRKDGLYGIGKQIKALQSRVLEVSRNRETFGIINIGGAQEGTSSGASRLHELRMTTSYADEEHVVGFEDDAQILGAKLLQGEPQRSVISILGMGGLGKTTLARKLYNNNKTEFNLHAWVCVSQEWKTRDLLERLIKSFKRLTKEELEMLEKMKDYDMEPYLRELLEGCRYLAVIDDMWHKEAWEILRRALPDNKNGSRIIITTRKEDVAEFSHERPYVHKLRFLRPDESWQLFSKKAFPENNGVCPPEMKKLGEEMMAKCDGLPLAIIVLGGLLSRKPSHEWPMVKERIWRELKKEDSNHVSSLLDLSYKDLPYELKSCFLYLGLFPEDFIINVEKLIQLWVAEEFIPPQGGEEVDQEEVAENYLKELIGRSLIQVVTRNWRTVSTCRVHDLLRDLAVNKAKELNFLHISDETKNSLPSTEKSSYRRIAIRSTSFDHSHERVRTLSFLNNHSYDAAKRLMRFKLLRVLDLEGVRVFGEVKLRLDEAVGKLIHLRYLGLKSTDIRELPKCIENLQALQTLDVSHNNLVTIPREISKLKQLRHLIGYFVINRLSPRAVPLLFEELTNLQTLKIVLLETLHGQKIGDHLDLNAFANLPKLKFLAVMCHEKCLLSVEPLLNYRHLIELTIFGGIWDLPKEMQKFVPNLKFLRLDCFRFDQDPIPALEMLPNLLVLELNDIQVKIMTFTATGFPQLEVLTLTTLLDGTKLQVEEGAMPRLRALTLDDEIKEGSTLPDRLRSLPDRNVLNWDWKDNY